MFVEHIIHHQTLALIIRHHDMTPGIEFFTPDDNALQVGQHHYFPGKVIKPHKHCPVKVERCESFQEVLYIEEGKVKILFYSDDDVLLEEKILHKGDMALLMEGGHGFEFLEETKMIEIKQGPYKPESRAPLEVRNFTKK